MMADTLSMVGRKAAGQRVRAMAVSACVCVGIAFAAAPVGAQTLQETLVETYRTNPDIQAEQAQVRATNEQLSQAMAGFRPTVTADAEIGRTWREARRDQPGATDPTTGTPTAPPGTGSQSEVVSPASVGINVTQPVYRGGRTVASIEQADAVIGAARAALLDVEQSTLLSAVIAYMDLLQAAAVVDLARGNENVIERQLQATRDRFNVGEVTRTDVAQAESRLAGAQSQRIAAEGDLRTARAAYEQVVGTAPPSDPQTPGRPTILPGSLEEALALAEQNNPRVIAATFTQRAAESGVDIARGGLLPEISVQGSLRRNYSDLEETGQYSDVASLTARLSVPLYQAGAQSSQVREARETASQRRIEVDSVQRGTVADAISAWETVATARARIESLESQVRAQQVTLEGIREEARVGERTVLDVLDAEQELLDARVDLINARRDEVVANYQLLAATGRLTVPALQLPVNYYDVEPDYRRSRDALWGTSID